MGTTDEEPNKPISFHDSSSPSQPLLSTNPLSSKNHPPVPPIPSRRLTLTPPSTSNPEPSPDSDPTQYLQISFNYGLGPFKDLPFLVLSTFEFSTFSICNRDILIS
ncbi:hypothetical protein ACOSQ2_015162 [Xanthoceras sorbifolium]